MLPVQGRKTSVLPRNVRVSDRGLGMRVQVSILSKRDGGVTREAERNHGQGRVRHEVGRRRIRRNAERTRSVPDCALGKVIKKFLLWVVKTYDSAG